MLVFVEKKKGFNQEALSLEKQCKELLNLDVKLRLLNGYDVHQASDEEMDQAKLSIFSEPQVDDIYDVCPTNSGTMLQKEPLPGQYDQRADSANQCMRLLKTDSEAIVTSFQVVLFDKELSKKEKETFLHFWINPIESREKIDDQEDEELSVLKTELENFLNWTEKECKDFIKDEGAAMNIEDFLFIQSYFKENLSRNIRYTEFKVLDTYWSDHCRHTTFETELENIIVNEGSLKASVEKQLDSFKQMRADLKREKKPITLMEMATINARHINDSRVEDTDEINACSIEVDVDFGGEKEKTLLMFKNETHNHPTEIEPFGGASTCIGGAIRDPLSGRSFVYQAMRLSACGDVTQKLEDTLENKLPQRIIAQKATQGYSSYGNQIGLATTYVKELYHDSYAAKHFECGAVVGSVIKNQVTRLQPEAGDVILLIGGKTGRDGIGGATGSSKSHTNKSLHQSGSEVQKGNAPEERKLQRYFGHPEVSKKIKKSNDFGAGGVSVAIGELADCVIELDRVPTKYKGLNALELAISESQERMAVVVDASDVEFMLAEARKENVEASIVASVKQDGKLIMRYKNEVVVDLPRDLIDSAGVRQKVQVECDTQIHTELQSEKFSKEALLQKCSDINVGSQRGLIDQFDASIGATTLHFPFGGKHFSTPSNVSLQKVYHPFKESETASVLSYGFIPKLSEINPYISAQAAVLESIAKVISIGGSMEDIFFSFQEYFPRLSKDKHKWGQVVLALMGAHSVQDGFKRPAIGGKDSMSGTFNDIDVVETLVSFAFSYLPISQVIDNVAKHVGSKLYLVEAIKNDDGSYNIEKTKEQYKIVQELIQGKHVQTAHMATKGIAVAVSEMCFGNNLGANLKTELNVLIDRPASLILESKEVLIIEGLVEIGTLSDKDLSLNGEIIDLAEIYQAYDQALDFLYPRYHSENGEKVETIQSHKAYRKYEGPVVEQVNVVIPVFPGTNCEYDTQKAFMKAGAHVKQVLINNLDAKGLEESLENLAKTIESSQILALAGGFSSGDEPDGSAKFIINVLKNKRIKEAIENLRQRDGLMIGICNGFQALVKSGYLPYGESVDVKEDDATLAHNKIHRHISSMVKIRQSTNASPWLSDELNGQSHLVPVSHGEGRLILSKEAYERLKSKGQIAYQYVDDLNQATMDPMFNVNGSDYAIESLISEDGRILGKMGHTERLAKHCFMNSIDAHSNTLFENGVRYFKED